MPVNRGPRRNHMIRISPIRLIGENGEQIGIIETKDALLMAQEAGLDLVEVSPDSHPPVCKLLDFGRHKYEQARLERQRSRNSSDSTPKEIRFRPNTGQGDLEVKIGRAIKFLDQGLRVKLTVRYRGAEMRRQDVGRETLRRATEMVGEHGKLESAIPEMQGRMLSVTVAPAKTKGTASSSGAAKGTAAPKNAPPTQPAPPSRPAPSATTPDAEAEASAEATAVEEASADAPKEAEAEAPEQAATEAPTADSASTKAAESEESTDDAAPKAEAKTKATKKAAATKKTTAKKASPKKASATKAPAKKKTAAKSKATPSSKGAN